MFSRMHRTVRRFIDVMKSGGTLEEAAGFYWNMSGRDARIRDQSHWCGAQRWTEDRWIEYGDACFDLARQFLERFAPPNYISELAQKTALEWGCGGGAIARPLCKSFFRVYGIDISRSSLDECERRMQQRGHENFVKVPFPAEHPERVLPEMAGASVDFIVSVSVFQHFPSKPYTRRVLGVMEKILKDGGYGLLQVRYDDGSPKFRQKDRDYARNVIYMTSFTPEEFTGQLQETGFRVLVRERDIDVRADNHDYYFVRKETADTNAL